MKRWRLSVLVLTAAFVPYSEAAADTNRPSVQASLREGWDRVVFGKELDHGEYLKLAGSLAASVAAANPAPLAAYLTEFVQESVRKLAVDLKTELILEALRSPGKVFGSGRWEFSAGFATYEHWKVLKIEVPDRVEIRGFEVRVTTRMESTRVQLPNTYQPYLRLRTRK